MASSRRSSPDADRADLIRIVERCLRANVRRGERVLVGLSGGLDSMVLLDLLGRISRRRGIRLAALHVNHQLSPNAPTWERFCRAACRERSIPFRSARVRIAPGASVEASARAARYAALLAQPTDYIALAHHQDDQAETVLLQLLRGAGVRGLAAMPQIRIEDGGSRIEGKAGIEDRGSRRGKRSREALKMSSSRKRASSNELIQPDSRAPIEAFEGGLRGNDRHRLVQELTRSQASSILDPRSSILNPAVLRPLLDVPRSEIERYARARGLSWVEDESNRDTRHARNFVRHELLPALAARFPSYRATLARSARHLGEAACLLDELAEIDAGGSGRDGVLAVSALRRHSAARARNLLRWFMGGHGVAMPNADLLEEVLRQILAARNGARVKVDLGTHDLFRWKGSVHLVPHRPPASNFAHAWRGQRLLHLPEINGVLRMVKGRGTGISLAKLAAHPVAIRGRGGGERLQPDCRRPRRTLKNLFQENGIPPWERAGLPLLFCGSRLVWVPGVGIDCEYRAAPHEPSVRPAWEPRAAG
jgi:tRNA(Ile)-lysidine synthase